MTAARKLGYRWRLREVPSLTDEFLDRVKLVGFADGEFERAHGSQPWTRDALLATRAEFRLEPGTNAVIGVATTQRETEEKTP